VLVRATSIAPVCSEVDTRVVRYLRLRSVPLGMLVVTVLVEAAAVALSWGLEPAYDTILYALFSIGLACTGALILDRFPRHVVGWILCGTAVANSVLADLAQGWGLRAAEQGWAHGPLAEWITTTSWAPQAPGFILLFLAFPSGRLPGRRWRAVVAASVLGALLVAAGWSFDARSDAEFASGRNPFARSWLPTDALFIVGMALLVVGFVASASALVLRYRRSIGVERLQLKWIALWGIAAAVALPVSGVLWNAVPAVHVLPTVVLTLLPVVIGIAILRHGLFDVDLVLSRSVAYVVLTGALAAAYAATALLLGTIVGHGSRWVTAGSTLVVAILFGSVRRRVQEAVDRRFRPKRFTAMRHVSHFLDELRAGRAQPEDIEQELRAALDDPTICVRVLLHGEAEPVDVRGRAVDTARDARRDSAVVVRGGVVLGAVVRDRSPVDHALFESTVEAAGSALEIVRLRVELQRRLDEVEESRARIVAAADDERRRIERDLHDGAQQRLVSIGLALRHAQLVLARGADEQAVSRTLDSAIAEVTSAIDELRELARGLRPALLDAGLGHALRDLASRTVTPVEVHATAERFPPDIETTLYFVACEGLTNAVKHARAERIVLRVERAQHNVVVTIADDGVGGASPAAGTGITGLRDRVVARGGSLRVDTALGHGTTIVAELPCAW
jgi:signal transduction histidine kinase